MAHLIDLLNSEEFNLGSISKDHENAFSKVYGHYRPASKKLEGFKLTGSYRKGLVKETEGKLEGVFEIPTVSAWINLQLQIKKINDGPYQICGTFLDQRSPYTIKTRSLRLATLIELNFINYRFCDSKMALHIENGQIIFRTIPYICHETFSRELFQAFVINNCINSLISVCNTVIQTLITTNNDLNLRNFKPVSNKQQIALNSILKYLKVSYIELDVSQAQVDTRKFINQDNEVERKRFHLEQALNLNYGEIKTSLELFQICDHLVNNDESALFLTEKEIKEMSPFLKFPKANIRNLLENEFIYNEIRIKGVDQLNLQPTGFKSNTANLMAAKIAFQYVYDQKTEQQSMTRKQPSAYLEKMLLVKIPARPESESLIQHERKIIKLFKSTKSGYLLKYYKTEQNCYLKNKLLMDYSPNFHSLDVFQKVNRKTLSMPTKLTIMSNLANGLRFLKNQQIVHMDLSAKNVLVGSGLLTKIIDFGESYNKKICGSDYRPGFTNPYGPPEVFTQGHFESKQDIFSLGILFFKIIFDSFPYQPTAKLCSHYRSKTYNQRFFFAIEHLEYIWAEKPILLLFSLFLRTNNKEVLYRPYATWCRVILKKIQVWYAEGLIHQY